MWEHLSPEERQAALSRDLVRFREPLEEMHAERDARLASVCICSCGRGSARLDALERAVAMLLEGLGDGIPDDGPADLLPRL